MTLAPIVLFVYNRPLHTKQTIESLKKNSLAEKSELFIFSDAAKNESDVDEVNKVREYINTVNGFKKVTVIEREKNWGLANSIIDGVTEIVNKYGKIIVLEDDLVTSPYFLKFMNEALEFYKDEKKVWHISGWNCPIKVDGLDDIFLWRFMNCWGWATWSDRWKYYEKDAEKTIYEFDKEKIKRFNLDGTEDFFSQVVENQRNQINTWAIFWYVTIFKQNGLCLNPTQTFVENIGQDGSGLHCGKNDVYTNTLSLNKNINFIKILNENDIALKRIKIFYKNKKKSFITRAINKLSRQLIKKNIIK